MKKLLLATSAIVLMAGNALADAHSSGISVSGSGNFGVKFSDGEDLKFHHEFDIKFSASGTTDGGLGFGAEVAIDNTEGTSASTTTSVMDGMAAGQEGTAAAQKISNYINVATADDGTIDACYLYMGKIYTKAELDNATAVDENGALTGASAVDVDIAQSGVEFKTNVDVAQELRGDVSVSLVDDLDTFGAAEANMNFWKSDAGMALEIHKVSPNGDEMFANCGANADSAFTAGNLYNSSSAVTNSASDVSGTMASSSTSVSVSNHATVYISLDNHKLSIGSDMDAADKLAGGIAEVGFDGVGVDDAVESIYGKSGGNDVRYDGTFGLAKVAVSYGDEEWAAGFSFDVAPIRIGAGFDSKGVASLGLGIKQGQISGNIFYSMDSDTNDDTDGKPDATGMGLDVTYQMSDATSVTLAFGRHEATDMNAMSMSKDAFGVGFSHSLGGGATLAAGVASVDDETMADLGIKMSF